MNDFCLEEISSEIKPARSIVMIKQDGSSLKGSLVAIDMNRRILVMSMASLKGAGFVEVAESDISQVKYRKARLRPKYMLLGFVAGPIVTKSVREIFNIDCGDGWGSIGCEVGLIYFSAAGGLLLGTVLPLIFPGHITVDCRQ